MRRVLINLQNYMFADAIERALRVDGDFHIVNIRDPAEVTQQCALLAPDVLFMEVTAYTPWKLQERQKIIEAVKNHTPLCKTVLMVDENVDSELAERVMQAKLSGQIDNFVFSSVSSSYLAALLRTV